MESGFDPAADVAGSLGSAGDPSVCDDKRTDPRWAGAASSPPRAANQPAALRGTAPARRVVPRAMPWAGAGWFAADAGGSCTSACAAGGLACAESALAAHNAELDSAAELQELIRDLLPGSTPNSCSGIKMPDHLV